GDLTVILPFCRYRVERLDAGRPLIVRSRLGVGDDSRGDLSSPVHVSHALTNSTATTRCGRMRSRLSCRIGRGGGHRGGKEDALRYGRGAHGTRKRLARRRLNLPLDLSRAQRAEPTSPSASSVTGAGSRIVKVEP